MVDLFTMLIKTSSCSDQDIIHIDYHIACSDLIVKCGIHHGLESGWRISESKEHNSGLKESSVCLEGCFPLIAIFYADIIISSLHIKLSEPLLLDELGD